MSTNVEHDVMVIHGSMSLPNQTATNVIQNTIKIISLLDKNVSLTQPIFDSLIKSFINVLTKFPHGHGYGYYNNNVADKQTLLKDPTIPKAISMLLKTKEINVQPIEDKLDILIKNGALHIISAMAESVKFNQSQTKNILNALGTHRHNGNAYVDTNKFFDNYLDSLFIDNIMLELMADFNFEHALNKIINKKIKVTQKCLQLSIKNNNLQLAKLMLLAGTHLDENVLITACENANAQTVKYILDNKIIPTKKCFDATLKNGNGDYDGNDNAYGYRRRYRKNSETSSQNASNIITLLIGYGYKMTYDDIYNATKNRIKIDKFDSLNIKLDQKFLELCVTLSFYPYNMDGITPTSACLEKECVKSGNITNIRKLLSQGVKPTVKCLQNASTIRNNLQVIRLLIEKGVKPDIICIMNMAKSLGSSSLDLLITEFMKCQGVKDNSSKGSNYKSEDNKNSENEESNNDNDDTDNSVFDGSPQGNHNRSQRDINTIGSEIKPTVIVTKKSDTSTESSDDEMVNFTSDNENKPKKAIKNSITKVITSSKLKTESESESEPIPKKIVKSKAKTAIKKQPVKKITKVENHELESGSEEEQKPKKVVNSKVKTTSIKKQPVKKVTKVKNSESELESSENDDEELKSNLQKKVEDLNQYLDIPTDYDFRSVRIIDQPIMTLLGQKNNKQSFVTIRKYLLTYLTKQKMITGNNIKLNKSLGVLVNKNENDVVELNNLDKLTYNLVKKCKIDTTEETKVEK